MNKKFNAYLVTTPSLKNTCTYESQILFKILLDEKKNRNDY